MAADKNRLWLIGCCKLHDCFYRPIRMILIVFGRFVPKWFLPTFGLFGKFATTSLLKKSKEVPFPGLSQSGKRRCLLDSKRAQPLQVDPRQHHGRLLGCCVISDHVQKLPKLGSSKAKSIFQRPKVFLPFLSLPSTTIYNTGILPMTASPDFWLLNNSSRLSDLT